MSYLDCVVVGDIFVDLVVQLTCHRLAEGGTTLCLPIKVELGGAGNVAAGLSALGGKVAFVGKAGKDCFGILYESDLKKKKIITRISHDKKLSTGLAIVFVNDRAERSFLLSRGANDALRADEIEKATPLIKQSKYAYFTGYSLVTDPQRSAILKGIETASKSNTKIVFDPGSHNLIRSNLKLFTGILDLCDVFSPNLDEAMAITNTTNTEDSIKKLASKTRLTALKCGQDGCILINRGDVLRIPGFKVTCVDTTGAGDAFTAALIYGLTHRLSFEATGRLANWFGANAVKRVGSRNFPRKSSIHRCLEELFTEDLCSN
jgi:sugar/nucleoside kinase (ribokinase family)